MHWNRHKPFVILMMVFLHATNGTGESADIDKTTALQVIQLWDTGPRTYNDVKLMARVRLITPYSCFPDEEFAAHQWAYQQIDAVRL